ncbi:uncharacterized protein LOC127807533 isoform X2 [Diospyros lotus]|uniref:uncharacterized protein LOC127807533 isoform X2 n=1 Tax=Diospyros lotus TaxID=55363 RepID=UPI00225A5F83|nr:uncharacterized protein LOC127807533 isoform X2 [Diospyros lotus]
MDGDGGPATGSAGSIHFSGADSTPPIDLTGQVHQLPCCVKYDGPCSVSHYFKPKSSGFVIGKKKSLGKRKVSDQLEENSNWEMNAKFQSITYWNHDSLPSQDDAFLRSFHFLTIAKALHQPVAPEDLESASIAEQTNK